MKLKEASDFLKNLLSKTKNKSETKIYKNFIAILTELKNRKLSSEELSFIETELDNLQLNVNSNNKKNISKRL